MSNNKQTEVMPPVKETRKMSARMRSEAMEAALDITATTTKLHAEDAVAKAKKTVAELNTKMDADRKAFREAAYMAAHRKAEAHPVVAAVQQLAKILAGADLRPDEVFHDLRVYSTGKSDLQLDKEFTIDAYPLVAFDHTRVEGNVSVRHVGSKVIIAMNLSDEDSLQPLWQVWYESDAELAMAVKVMRDAQRRLDNHGMQVDVARVQLQRGKLTSMGAGGEAVLAQVNGLLEAGTGDDFLKLL